MRISILVFGNICQQTSDLSETAVSDTVEDVFVWSVRPNHSVNPPLTAL